MGRIRSKKQYKKKISNTNIRAKDIKVRESLTVEKFTPKPKADIRSKLVEGKTRFKKNPVSLISPQIKIDIEKNKLRRIKSGKLTIDGTLDLHGFSLREAENQLKTFVSHSLRKRKRLLLIITGKGSNSKPNIYGKTLTIRSEIKHWLLDSFYQDKVQYISKALDQHGGAGAYYFFLKKSKNIFS